MEHLDTFWELLDELLNAVLFVLIGMEVLVLQFTPGYLLAGVLAILIVLFARMVSVAIPVGLLRLWREFSPGVVKVLTWGGVAWRYLGGACTFASPGSGARRDFDDYLYRRGVLYLGTGVDYRSSFCPFILMRKLCSLYSM